ncbi:RNA polymerase sigma factor RpoH [Telmatospirillum sp. J64-1]|uniref:RNA polymerase sigma factor RpoH n=1 Tax=Telmatospirillum sp. J64-1 TaxID=2502183 RepID=UPI00115C83C0|nr:RNA polymerase sigma factor RpoH [Telmatospirillum sp. J64-1]
MSMMMTVTPASGMARYLQDVRRYPMLDADQELELAMRWRDSRDPEAARLLVGSHLRLVVKIAKGFRGYGLPIEDLIAEGNVGLMQAVERFDPDRGFRLATYALWWIRAMIQEHILHSWSLVKMGTTASQKKLFFNLRSAKARLNELENGDLSPETVAEIARDLDVSEEDVVAMNRRIGGDRSLNVPLSADEPGGEWQDFLMDDRENQEELLGNSEHRDWQRSLVAEAMAKLNDRERTILSERRFLEEPPTLEELGKRYGVSRERVRQIEEKAFDKLKRMVGDLLNSDKNKLAMA